MTIKRYKMVKDPWDNAHMAVRDEGDYVLHADHLTENTRLRAALMTCINMLDDLVAESGRGIEYGEEDAFRMGEWFDDHDLGNIDTARAILATPAPDAVQESAISEVVQHESTRRWFHGEATHEEIMECVKAMDAAVAKWRAIAGDRT